MARQARSSTEQALQHRAATHATGRLTVGAGAGEMSIYLLDGEAVAARAADDAAVLVERLAAVGILSAERARQLQAMQAMSLPILGREGSDPILGLLLDQLEGEAIDDALRCRFDEVLASFLTHVGEPSFTADAAPWAHLVRTVGGTLDHVDHLGRRIELAAGLDPHQLVFAGPTEPTSLDEAALVAPVIAQPRTVAEILDRLGLPDLLGRARIADALERGVLIDGTDAALPETDFAELEAFSGVEDSRRGGSRDGTFVQEASTLDRVELVTDDEPVAEPSYAAPTLSEEDAFDKIGVANEVLRAIFTVLVAHGSAKDARRVLQVLVDGRPRPFVPLLDGVQVSADGQLPSVELLANLRQRLPSEQRHLLNQGLLDLLDRTLDRTAEDLPEEAFDELLEEVIGYRQRLGL